MLGVNDEMNLYPEKNKITLGVKDKKFTSTPKKTK